MLSKTKKIIYDIICDEGDFYLNILLTNDDGYTSFLLNDMYRFLPSILPDSTITVIAPHANKSAISSALSFDSSCYLREIQENFFSLEGYPVDCVKMALHLKKDFDIVISGPNMGSNLGNDIIYSGTIAAARESAIANIPSIALSILDDVHNINTIDMQQWHSFLIKWLVVLIDIAKAHSQSYVNVNVPLPVSLYLREAELSQRKYNNSFQVNTVSHNESIFPKEYIVHRNFSVNKDDIPVNTDWFYTMQGYSVMTIIPVLPRSIKSKIILRDI